MTLQIGNGTLNLKLYNNPFCTDSKNETTVNKENFLEENQFIVKVDKTKEKEITESIKNIQNQNITVCSEQMPTSVQSFSIDGFKRILKDCFGIDLQGFPSMIDLLDNLANGLLTQFGDKVKEYVKTIKEGIKRLKENWSKSTTLKEGLHNFFDSLKVGLQMIINIPATILGTAGEAVGSLLKKIFGEKAGKLIGQTIGAVLAPLNFLLDITFGSVASIINHLIKKSKINKNIANIVKDIIVTNVMKTLTPIINPIIIACGYPPLPNLDDTPKPAPKKKNILEIIRDFFTTPIRKFNEFLDERYQKALQKAVEKYMTDHKQDCKNIMIDKINETFDLLEKMINNKINSASQEKFNELKNKMKNSTVTTYDKHTLEQYFMDIRNFRDSRRREDILKHRKIILDDMKALNKLCEQCTLLAGSLSENQRKELDEMKKTVAKLNTQIEGYMKIVKKRYQY